MTIEEAIDYLSEGYCDVKPTDNEDMIKLKHKHNDAYEIALEALEKQIPKKPIYSKYGNRDSCPRCNEIINYRIDNHCHRCGQKIDWSEVKE